MMHRILLSIVLISSVYGCERLPSDSVACDVPLPPAGSNEVLRTKVRVADNLEVIISNVYIPSGAQVPRHYHPGEEFLYVVQGSAVHVEEGQADRVLTAGEAYVIPPEAVHAPYGGPDGGHAIVFRLHVDGMEERYPVP
jgi:quercetin dioxygenase-like cupin family protein